MTAVRRRPSAAALLGLLLLVSACIDFPLIDPADPEIPVVGAIMTLWRRDGLDADRLEFEGFVYGHVVQDGRRYRRYLDAGAVTVAGRPAARRFPRPAEPLYYYQGTAAALSSPVRLEINGSGAVAPCVLDLDLPVLAWPADAGVIRRGRDLVLPVDFGGERPPSSDRISAEVRLTGAAPGGRATAVGLDIAAVESEILIPWRLLEALPAGRARLTIDIVWERTRTSDPDSARCAPTVTVSSTLHANRWLLLE